MKTDEESGASNHPPARHCPPYRQHQTRSEAYVGAEGQRSPVWWRPGDIKETFDELFLAKLRGGWSLAIQQVFDLSLYCEQIERYLNIFPRERVHIILQEELSKDAEKMVRQIYSFLNVDNTFFPNISIKHNTYRTPSNSLVRKLYQNKRTRKTVEALLPNVMKKRLGKRIMKQGTSQPINQVLVRQARKYYASDVAKLSELIGIDLGKTWGY